MANEEHLRILKQRSEVWNQWRREHDEIVTPDLRGADLSGSNLGGANLFRVNLTGTNLTDSNLTAANLTYAEFNGANLTGAKLGGANLVNARLNGVLLSRADLNYADLRNADLNNANLSAANLVGADLRAANLIGADLRAANFPRANFIGADIRGADVSNARADETIFGSIDLREVKGLESIRHGGPSEVSISAVYLSEGDIPEVFLRGCGLRDWEIEATKLYRTDLNRNQIVEITYKVFELRSDPLIQFNSCFISYSSKDEEFAKRLYADLQDSGVRCWFAPEDMKIGDRIRHRIDDSIRLHDKLLLILSETSTASQWIEQEVETALEKERERGCDVLFPVRLDDTVMNIQRGWPALIRKTRHIGDFRQWEDYREYQKGYGRLLEDLRIGA